MTKKTGLIIEGEVTDNGLNNISVFRVNCNGENWVQNKELYPNIDDSKDWLELLREATISIILNVHDLKIKDSAELFREVIHDLEVSFSQPAITKTVENPEERLYNKSMEDIVISVPNETKSNNEALTPKELVEDFCYSVDLELSEDDIKIFCEQMYKNESKKQKEYQDFIKRHGELSRNLGQALGLLKGIMHHNIPSDLKEKIENSLKEIDPDKN